MWPFKAKKKEVPVPGPKQPRPRLIGLTRAETNAVKLSLDYTHHRLTKHEHCGVRGIINEQVVKDLREKLV